MTLADLQSPSPGPPTPSASLSPGPVSGSSLPVPAVAAAHAVPAPQLPHPRDRLSKPSFSYDKLRSFRPGSPLNTKIASSSGGRPQHSRDPMSARCVHATRPDIREALEDNQTLRTQFNRVGAPVAATWESLRYDATLKTLAYGGLSLCGRAA